MVVQCSSVWWTWAFLTYQISYWIVLFLWKSWWSQEAEEENWQLSLLMSLHGNSRLSWHVCMLSCLSRVRLYETLQSLWDCSPPGSPSMEFPRQEYWCGLPFPPPGDLPNPGIEPMSHMSPALKTKLGSILSMLIERLSLFLSALLICSPHQTCVLREISWSYHCISKNECVSDP